MRLKGLQVGIILVATISAFSSFLVMLTFFTFKEMRSKKFMQFIFYISLSDFFLNISSAFGFPSNDDLCFAQGLISSVFAMSSWLWVTCLSYSMYTLITRGSFLAMWYFHVLCWGFPLISSLVPLTMSTYGKPSPREQWCTFVSNNDTKFWSLDFSTYGLYWGWFFICVICMIYWEVTVFRIVSSTQTPATETVKNMYSKIALYPFVITVCWIFNFIVDELGTNSELLSFFSMLIGTLNGFFAALVFFWKSGEARTRWFNLIKNRSVGGALIAEEDVVVVVDFDEESALEKTPQSSINSFSIHLDLAHDSTLRISLNDCRQSFVV